MRFIGVVRDASLPLNMANQIPVWAAAVAWK
jgi:hypothetical protein